MLRASAPQSIEDLVDAPGNISDDDDDDEILSKERERRYAELRAHQRAQSGAELYGTLEELPSEQALLHMSVNCPPSTKIVVHFCRRDFQRCQQLSEALAVLARSRTSSQFVELDATKAPYLTGRWGIRQLPTTVILENKEAVDRIIGFEGIMNDRQELDPKQLEDRIFNC